MISVDIKETNIPGNFLPLYYNGEFLDITEDSMPIKGIVKFSINGHNVEYQIPNFETTGSTSAGSRPIYGLIKDDYYYVIYVFTTQKKSYYVYVKVDLTNYTSYINSYEGDIIENSNYYYFDFIEIDGIEYMIFVLGSINSNEGQVSSGFAWYIFNENQILSTYGFIIQKDCALLKLDYNNHIAFLYDKINKTLLSVNSDNAQIINQNISSSIFQNFVNNILNPNINNLICISNKFKDNKFGFLFSNKVVVFSIIDENNISNYEEVDIQNIGTPFSQFSILNYASCQMYNFGGVNLDIATFKQYIVLINESNYNVTLKFDNDVVKTYTKTTDTILKAVKISLLGGSITANLTYSKGDNDFISTLQYPNSYKYATSVTIGENTYNITDNAVEVTDLNISSDVEIRLNNGVIAYYDITFKNDTQLLQIKRTEEDTLPVYEGETPVQEGKVFIGWNPEIYAVDKDQIYHATFENAPFTITIADSGSNNFDVLWLDTQSTAKTREFSTPITLIRINHLVEPYSHMVSLILGYGDSESCVCLITYKENNVIPQNFKIEDSTYNFGTDYSVNIDSNTTINIVANARYFIRFLNYDDSVLETKYVYSGVTPTYTGETPYQKGYDFTGWNPDLYPADKKQDYKAKFTIQTFTIRFLNDDGSVLESKSVNYGETPTYTGATPTKEGYTFNGWSPVLYPANKNQDYTATYRNSAFALTLYKNTAENNRIDKTDYLTSVGEITGYLRQETNIINPSIVIEYTGVIDFNYVYISTFNRYYFVNNITSVRTNLWRLDMSCDTLMTYKETILNYECYVSRNENDYNEDIEDKYLPLEYEKVVDYILQQDTTGTNPDFFKGFSALITTLATSPEVNLESENIEITTPFNDLDGEPAKTNIYEAGSSNFKVIQMITDSGAYASCLNAIANALIQDDTKAGFVQSIIVFPIWNPAMYDQIGYKTMTDFYYGSEKLPLGGTYNVVLKGDTIAPMKIATIYVRPKFNNFLDYDPYTTYEIWLPFYGWAKLPSEQVVGHYLNVYYVINTSSTKGTIIIRQETDSAVILQVDCTIGVEVPISTTNAENIKRRATSDAINYAVQGVGGVLMGAVGVVTGNPLLAFGGAMMATGAITGGISSSMTNRVEAQGKVSDGNAGLYSDRVVKIRRTSSIVAVDDITKYAKYIGRPLQTNVKLNTLTGYTIVGGVHVENLGTATDNEKTDIENQLRKGVII